MLMPEQTCADASEGVTVGDLSPQPVSTLTLGLPTGALQPRELARPDCPAEWMLGDSPVLLQCNSCVYGPGAGLWQRARSKMTPKGQEEAG